MAVNGVLRLSIFSCIISVLKLNKLIVTPKLPINHSSRSGCWGFSTPFQSQLVGILDYIYIVIVGVVEVDMEGI